MLNIYLKNQPILIMQIKTFYYSNIIILYKFFCIINLQEYTRNKIYLLHTKKKKTNAHIGKCINWNFTCTS